jgi:microcystin-dependent protein
MAANNVQITSAVYANARGSIVSVLLTTGETWRVPPGNGSGQANVLDQWVKNGGSIGPYVPPVPGGVVPIGTLIWYASTRTPSGWLPCDGTAVKRLQYPNLFTVIGTTFGIGNGSTTFNLPDLTDKFIRGWGPVNSLDPDRQFASDQDDLLFSHTHPIRDPGHTHGVTDPSHVHEVTDPGHKHTANDLGHTHGVSDPGHLHTTRRTEIGYLAEFATSVPSIFIAPLGYTPSERSYQVIWEEKNAALVMVERSANLGTQVANAGLSDLTALTGISVDPASTGIQTSFEDGGIETRPPNLSLLPYIKY